MIALRGLNVVEPAVNYGQRGRMIERYSPPAVVLHWLIAVCLVLHLHYGFRFE